MTNTHLRVTGSESQIRTSPNDVFDPPLQQFGVTLLWTVIFLLRGKGGGESIMPGTKPRAQIGAIAATAIYL